MEDVERSGAIIDEADFKTLLDLCETHPWIKLEYRGLVALWNDFPDPVSRNLIVSLIQKFRMLTSFDMRPITEAMATFVQNSCRLSPKDTIFFAVSDDFDVDGSQAFLQQLKNDFPSTSGWSEKNFRNSLIDCRSAMGNHKRYVLFDDFFGTGRTINRKAKAFASYIVEEKHDGNEVFLLGIAGMNAARELLDETGFAYHAPIWLDRGISDSYDSNTALVMKKAMKEMERTLSRRYNGQFLPSMGYGSSESLFSIHNFNCPNNVFPILWWPTNKKNKPRTTILKRLR